MIAEKANAVVQTYPILRTERKRSPGIHDVPVLHSLLASSTPIRKCRCEALAQQRQEASLAERVSRLNKWLLESHGVQQSSINIEYTAGMYSATEEFRSKRNMSAGESILELPADLGITAADARSHPDIQDLASGRDELVCLALWLIAERSKGSGSKWKPFLDSLPQQTESPILWSKNERQEFLRGSPVIAEAASRAASLEQEFESMAPIIQENQTQYPPDVYSKEAFLRAMSVVLAHAAYLNSAECFALLPLATLLRHSGGDNSAQLDFNLDTQMAALVAPQPYKEGEIVSTFDARSNGELFLATGTVEDNNPADCLYLRAELLKSDRLYTAKKSIVDSLGYSTSEEFPVYADRMPLQLLAYFRLSRIQDPAELAKVSFQQDTIVSQNNEYEILQLLFGECTDRLSLYPGSAEEQGKKLQRRDLSRRERLGTQLQLAEQRILQGTVNAIRRRLAPIRGIPTKSGGMTDPNEDLKEIFDTIENLPQAPLKLFGGLMSWARGEQDPTWKKNKKRKSSSR